MQQLNSVPFGTRTELAKNIDNLTQFSKQAGIEGLMGGHGHSTRCLCQRPPRPR
jgi:hypothetical protein